MGKRVGAFTKQNVDLSWKSQIASYITLPWSLEMEPRTNTLHGLHSGKVSVVRLSHYNYNSMATAILSCRGSVWFVRSATDHVCYQPRL